MIRNFSEIEERRSEPAATSRFYNVQLSERDAWFASTIAVLFNALGMLIELAIARKVPGVSSKPIAISALIALMLLVVLFIRRKTPSVKWASIIYLINSAAVAMALLSTNIPLAAGERHWVPFQATKLGCLIAAMIAPGFWVGLVSILLYSVSACVQFEFFFPPEVKNLVDSAEPWPIIAFALGGRVCSCLSIPASTAPTRTGSDSGGEFCNPAHG